MTQRLLRLHQWNDLHVRDHAVTSDGAGYPNCNGKAAWLLACARGEVDGCGPSDLVLSAGDLVCRDLDADFAYLRRNLLDPLPVPLLPCVGNHENRQGEGMADHNRTYDRWFGPGWHDYLFTVSGLAFVVLDTSGAHRQPDAITGRRRAFFERALERAGAAPVVLVTHVPLVAMRREAALAPSFGFSSWKVLDGDLLAAVESHAERVVAVLSGHLHLSCVVVRDGIYHIDPSGTAGYPADFAAIDVYGDRLEVEMLRAPAALIGDPGPGNIHGSRRHGVDYTDADHIDHESYLSGNETERRFTVPLGGRRHAGPGPHDLVVWHEDGPGRWRQVESPR